MFFSKIVSKVCLVAPRSVHLFRIHLCVLHESATGALAPALKRLLMHHNVVSSSAREFLSLLCGSD